MVLEDLVFIEVFELPSLGPQGECGEIRIGHGLVSTPHRYQVGLTLVNTPLRLYAAPMPSSAARSRSSDPTIYPEEERLGEDMLQVRTLEAEHRLRRRRVRR
jgi:hypothetical protein